MARNVILSTLARMDLNDIADYTLERWGEDQALAYQQKLIDRINWIARNPQMGHLREDLLVDMFCFRESSHLIFYQTFNEDVEILRIIHQAADVKNIFG